MSRRVFAAGIAGALLAARCNSVTETPPVCDPIAAIEPGMPPDTVWGFADLHSHPAIERAFLGHLIWGTAVDDAPVDAAQLPRIAACPVETHDRDATSPVDRAVGEQLFPQVAGLTGFAHGPVGSVDYRNASAWPNGRDVIHQQMNVASIRRAYEGGLRLMFAATTDDQVIAALLNGPNLVDAFVPQTGADYDSARAQIELMQSIVEQNASWMGIARSPSEARTIINGGRLAIVLSLEMEGLREQDVDSLRDDFGVRHITPIHLIDNDIGGTAANGDLFNAASAEVSSIYRSDQLPRQYMNLEGTPRFDHAMGWPKQLGTLSVPVYAELDDVPYAKYSGLCYEPLSACSGSVAGPANFIELGQVNARGLCSTLAECMNASNPRPGSARIRHFMDTQMFVDLSHMSAKSIEETIAIDPSFPLMASHGDVAHLCAGNPKQPPCNDDEARGPVSERSIEGEAARTLVARGGVLGFGVGMKSYGARAVMSARGGPLLTLTQAAAQASIVPVFPPVVTPPAPTTTIQSLAIQTIGGISSTTGNAQPFVRIEMRANAAKDSYQRHVFEAPLTCSAQSCNGSVALGTRDDAASVLGQPACAALDCATANACNASSTYTIDDIESVTLEWLYLGCDLECQKSASGVSPRQCQSTWDDARAPHWTIEQVDLSATPPAQATPVPVVRLASSPLADLGRNRGSLVVYERNDRPETAADSRRERTSPQGLDAHRPRLEPARREPRRARSERVLRASQARYAHEPVRLDGASARAGRHGLPEWLVESQSTRRMGKRDHAICICALGRCRNEDMRIGRFGPRLARNCRAARDRRSAHRGDRGSRRPLGAPLRGAREASRRRTPRRVRARHRLQRAERRDGHLRAAAPRGRARGIRVPGLGRCGRTRAARADAIPQPRRHAGRRSPHRRARSRHVRHARGLRRDRLAIPGLRNRRARLVDALGRSDDSRVGSDRRSANRGSATAPSDTHVRVHAAMKRAVWILALAAISHRANAGETPFAIFPKSTDGEPASATEPGYFNGIGTKGRYWEIQSNTSFDTNRILTERVELASAIPLKFISPLVTLVARASFGANTDVNSSIYGIQGPIVSLGLRDRSKSANYWVEFGLRALPNYSSPHDTEPAAQQLALRSTFSSGIADDAAWLPLSSFGAQIYLSFQSRFHEWTWCHNSTFFAGAQFGGAGSLAPLAVKTWLGPQNGFVGNVYVELFIGSLRLGGSPANLELGVHGEASLSSIWPGNEPLPVVGNVFVGWSPKSWVSVRIFGGLSGAPTVAPVDNQYGTRIAFFVP